ncbi:Mitochondrial inner membrane protease subunit 2 [Tetrabaena socialis]|uniref:Mitochondrial inner membrane protease subunit 2 n=1 Tax=Tetrabaena socialis TaxID=47790 RepID=A0A2J8ACW9_9CHLO|nr:Mitochondrial inner membrane protease subunit 2 [Tetrabaena socialis]|eukprot:PNH10360.1 Mitochondrial inner membrane protease subunit 2 [Tetrabaena socialis]
MGGFFRQLVWWLPAGIALTDTVLSVLVVEGQSMWPTLNGEGRFWRDVVVVEKLTYKWQHKYQRGDVAVLWAPDQPHQQLVKRIIAVEYDVVWDSEKNAPQKIPQAGLGGGRCWMEGDNPDASGDSRNVYGPVHLGLLEGRVTHVLWPPWRSGAVRRWYPHDRLIVEAGGSNGGPMGGRR